MWFRGKGGTGKSLLSAVSRSTLGTGRRKSVLLVDLDVFVRGLTYFFYTFRQERRILTDGWVVADVLSERREGDGTHSRADNAGVTRFFEVELLPAVADIEEQLVMQGTQKQLDGVTVCSKT